MNHDEAAEVLGAYALDAVDRDEALEIGDHVRDCPRCRDELARHREVATHLVYVGAPAPAGVWSRIASELGEAEPGPAVPRLLTRRSPWVARVVSVAAAVVAVAVGLLGWQLHDEQTRVQALQSQVNVFRVPQLMAAAELDPSSARFKIESADHRTTLDVVLARGGTGYLAANNALPALAADRTYQLWGVGGGRAISLGVMGNRPGVVAFPDALSGLKTMAITVEPRGGSPAPTNVPLAAGAIPAGFEA